MTEVRNARQASAEDDDPPVDDGGMLHSVRTYPVFRMLLLGTLASSSGFWMYQVAIGWLALELTDSPLFVGLAGFAGGIPLLVLSIPAGVVIDRRDRRSVLLMAQTGVTVVSTVFALAVGSGAITPWSMIVLLTINGTIMTFIFPVRTAIVPSLVDRKDLANAIALMSAAQNATRVVGPSLAGVLIALTGVTGTFVLAAVLQGLALLGIWQLPRSKQEVRISSGRRMEQLTVGFRIVAANPFLLAMIVLALAPTVLVMPYINLMPVFARDELGMGATGLGILLAATGLGTVAGALGVARSAGIATRRGSQVVTAAGFAIGVILFSVSPNVWIAIPFLFLAGLMSAAFLAINQTVLQLNVDDDVRGRVLSVSLLTWGMLPVGQLAVGALADAAGTPTAMTVSCVLALGFIAFIASRFSTLR